MPPETDDRAARHYSLSTQLQNMLSWWLVQGIMFVIRLYDFVSWPLYYTYQNPWIKLEKARKIRATRENLAIPSSPYYRIGEHRMHYLKGLHTIPEAQKMSLTYNDPHQPSLGYREILDVKKEYSQKEKKIIKKYVLSDYRWLTILQVDQKITQLEGSFRSLNVKHGDRVLIFSDTRIDWFLCAHAIFRTGAAVITLYPTLGEEGIRCGIEETDVQVIITSQELIDRLPHPLPAKVTTLIYFQAPLALNLKAPDKNKLSSSDSLNVMTYKQFCQLPPQSRSNQEPTVTEDDAAVILYTSGSTGKPKGVILTHKNFMTTTKAVFTVITQEIIDEYYRHTWYGYLPLAHILEFVAEMVMFCAGIKIGYGSPFTMTDYSTGIIRGQPGDVTLLKPTVIPGVPLVLERIRKQIMEKLDKRSKLLNSFLKYFILELASYKDSCIDRGVDTPILNHFICNKFRAPFGGRIEYMLIGGASLSLETQRLMRALLNVKILLGYGSTETCGANMVMDFDDTQIGSVGAPLYGVKLRLEDWVEGGYTSKDKPFPRGELHVGGGVVSKGYFGQEELTKEAFYVENDVQWFRTGDIAEVNPQGIFTIIDRKKDLLKLQHGEYVSLGKVEAELKNCPIVDNVCVYGDSHHTYVIALIMPNWELMSKIYAKSSNDPSIVAARANIPITQLKTMCSDKELLEEMLFYLMRFCHEETKLCKTEIPQRIILCAEEWTTENDLITAAMKIKRLNIRRFYQKKIDEVYRKEFYLSNDS